MTNDKTDAEAEAALDLAFDALEEKLLELVYEDAEAAAELAFEVCARFVIEAAKI